MLSVESVTGLLFINILLIALASCNNAVINDPVSLVGKDLSEIEMRIGTVYCN